MAQSYKVFIENKSLLFNLNPNHKGEYTKAKQAQQLLKEIKQFPYEGITLSLKNEKKFWDIFKDYKFVEAAGGIVQYKNDFLFIERLGVWDIPKGKMEKGESVEETAVREIEEECGIQPPKIKKHLIDTYHTYEMFGKKHLKRTYWFWLEATSPLDQFTPQTEENISQVKLFKAKDFGQIKENTYQSVIDVIEALENELK